MKTNIGHLDAAAGVAGLDQDRCSRSSTGRSRRACTSRRRTRRSTSRAQPVHVQHRAADWPARRRPRRAGVSSFGIGGTNAHVDRRGGASTRRRPGPRDPPSCSCCPPGPPRRSTRDGERPGRAPRGQPGAVARRRRVHAPCRTPRVRAPRGSSCAGDAPRRCARPARPAHRRVQRGRGSRRSSFLFPGQGAQYVGMGRGLYESEPRLPRERRPLRGDARARTSASICASVLYPPPEDVEAARAQLADDRAHPARAVRRRVRAGARSGCAGACAPQAMLGHSIGEYVAACLAGVIRLRRRAGARRRARTARCRRLPRGRHARGRARCRSEVLRSCSGISVAAVNAPDRPSCPVGPGRRSSRSAESWRKRRRLQTTAHERTRSTRR